MSRKINYRSACCRATISKDAAVRWCAAEQEWEISCIYDNEATCDECGKECDSVTIDHHTCELLAEAPGQYGVWLPVADAEALRAAWHEQNRKDIEAAKIAREAEARALEAAQALASYRLA